MTNTPSPDEDRELIEHLRDMAQGLDCGPEEENGPFHSALSEAADRLESLLSDRAKLELQVQEATELLAEFHRFELARLRREGKAVPATGVAREMHDRTVAALNRSTDRAT